MATTKTRPGTTYRIAPLTPDSPDAEARAMANSPELIRMLEEAREQARRPGGTISQEELERGRPLTEEERIGGEALLAEWLAEDEAAGVIEQPASSRSSRKRVSGAAANVDNDRLHVRVPHSVRRALAERATEEGVSISQLVLSYVTRGLSQDVGDQQPVA
jgi:hypothetical protein